MRRFWRWIGCWRLFWASLIDEHLRGCPFRALFRAMPEPYWAVAKTHAQREGFAAERLTERGFETFLPRVASGRSIQPLFRSYCFVRIVDGHWLAIERTMGVFALVRFGDCPARCPDREVEALMDRVDPDGIIRLPAAPPAPPRKKIPAGSRVKVVAGPLQGVAALHSGMSRGEREILLIAMLGSSRRVAVPAHLVAVA
jgi:transcription antitermination factor NusG